MRVSALWGALVHSVVAWEQAAPQTQHQRRHAPGGGTAGQRQRGQQAHSRQLLLNSMPGSRCGALFLPVRVLAGSEAKKQVAAA